MTRSWTHRCGLAFALALCAFGVAGHADEAQATTMLRMTTRELTRASQDVVLGEVVGVRSEWTSDRRMITRVTIRVNERLKGDAAGIVEVVQLGGEVDGVKVSVPGCPSFRPGEEAVLFLAGTNRARLQVTGLAQGKFEVTRAAGGKGEALARRAPGFETGDARRLTPTVRGGRTGVPLDSLVAEVRRSIGEER